MMIQDLRTDARADRFWLLCADLVDAMSELLSDDCPAERQTKLFQMRRRHYSDPERRKGAAAIKPIHQRDAEVASIVTQKKRLAESIRENGLREGCEVQFRLDGKGRLGVIDGLHRSAILRSLDRPVPAELLVEPTRSK